MNVHSPSRIPAPPLCQPAKILVFLTDNRLQSAGRRTHASNFPDLRRALTGQGGLTQIFAKSSRARPESKNKRTGRRSTPMTFRLPCAFFFSHTAFPAPVSNPPPRRKIKFALPCAGLLGIIPLKNRHVPDHARQNFEDDFPAAPRKGVRQGSRERHSGQARNFARADVQVFQEQVGALF